MIFRKGYVTKQSFYTLFFLLLLTTTEKSYSQTYSFDALRYSRSYFGGTARFQGIAGAGAALGGDMSSAYSNPAGLGYNRSSELSISPSVSFNNSTSSYFNENPNQPFSSSGADAIRLNPNISHFGYIKSNQKNTDQRFKGGSFAITFTRLNNFHQKIRYEGVNDTTSIVDSFIENANGTPSNEFENQNNNGIYKSLETLAYFTYLTNPFFATPSDTTTRYYSFLPIVPTQQEEEITRKGAHNQWSISYGGNYDDRIYFGATLGIQTLKYKREKIYRENPLLNNSISSPLSSLTITENLSVNGAGVNLSAGIIYNVTNRIRLGASITTPTFMHLEEEEDKSLESIYQTNYFFNDSLYKREFYGEEFAIAYGINEDVILNQETGKTTTRVFDYTMISSFKLTFGGAYFFGKDGFVSADLEMVNYSNVNLESNYIDDDFFTDNLFIENNFKSSLNFRLGGELRRDPFRFRGGYAYYQNPADGLSEFNDTQFITLGVGIRKEGYYFDISLVNKITEESYSPYQLSNHPSPQIESDIDNVSLTFSCGILF